MDIRIITKPIMRAEVKEIAKEFYVDMVKGAVDIEREILALGGEYHMDANMALIGNAGQSRKTFGDSISTPMKIAFTAFRL